MGYPTHAKTKRPALVELAMWAVSRAAHRVGPLIFLLADTVAGYRTAYRNASTPVRRLAVATAVLAFATVALLVLAVLIIV
jgi:hypothetical protein